MPKSVTLWGATYSNVPALEVPSGNGTALFTDVSPTTATVSDVAQGKIFFDASGNQQTGTASTGGGAISIVDTQDSHGGTIRTITAEVVTTGTEGTPTATKGSVSNHSISVTPSVTNTAGMIQGGTHTGTAVTVSASELVSGTLSVTDNGTHDVTNYASVNVNVSGGGSSKNIQIYQGVDYARATSYTATDVAITCAKTGYYNVSWVGWRSTSSGTSGSRLYVNGSAEGSAHTSFSGTYGQYCEENNMYLEEGDVLVVRARARGTSYYMYVGQLIIEEQ